MRLRRVLRLFVNVFLLAVIAALTVEALLLLFGPRLERAIAARIEAEGAQRGLHARARSVRVAPFSPLRLNDLSVEKPGLFQARISSLSVSPRLVGCSRRRPAARVAVGQASLGLPAGLVIDAQPSVWDIRGLLPFTAELCEPTEGLTLTWTEPGQGRSLELHAARLRISLLARLLQDGAPVVDPELVDGDARLDLRPSGETSVDVRLLGPGAELSGRGSLSGGPKDPRLELSLDVPRLDFSRFFAASGLKLLGDIADLGRMSLALRVSGRLADPDSLVVDERLDFAPPHRPPDALLRLRGPFRHEVELPDGGRRTIEVSPDSPDFVSRDAVPPLFVRTLLLAEDTGFYGHRGVDLKEMVAALATSFSKGEPPRGASTLTQQLAKNLFLTRERSLRRKVLELALALLLEPTLGKERILEIYLNVIEWGPGVYGLRPAVRHYFGKEPADLSPKEMAFLVALIPGPIRYQRSFAQGALTPGFEPLVFGLLAKLHSVGGLSDEEYQAALKEALVFSSTAESEPSPP